MFRMIIDLSMIIPAYPKQASSKPSKLFTATPPQANASRSIFRLLARRRAKMPSLANASSDSGSIPFWLMITNVFYEKQGCERIVEWFRIDFVSY